MPNIVKTKFAGLLRGLLRRFDEKEARGAEAPRSADAILPAIKPAPVAPMETFRPARVITPSVPVENSNELKLPLQSIFSTLPMELRAKIAQAPPPDATMTIPVDKVVTQLALGSVKISFGELRLAAPATFANCGGELDSRPVTLPLNEILARLNPALLMRRDTQKQVEVADDITGPFGARGRGVTFTNAPSKPETPPSPTPRRSQPVSPTPISTPAVRVTRSVTPAAPTTTHDTALSKRTSSSGAPGSSEKKASDSLFNAAPQIPAAPVDSSVLVPLSALTENWPEGLKLEILQSNATDAQVALPANLIEAALKRGRVTFFWKSLRELIRPTPLAVSVFDSKELELPLKVVAPLFLTRQKTASKPRQKIQVSEEIPNLFFGFPTAQPASATPEAAKIENQPAAFKTPDAKATDTDFYPRGQSTEMLKTDATEFKHPVAPATDFSSRSVSPQEVIARAMELSGVAGAVITLLDGLKVAGQVPPEMDADAIAAFLPQVFARVGQCTRELRAGQLNNLNFTLGRVQWKIFRVNGIFFAAFGHSGKQLPAAQLLSLVTQLERKK